jgi:hypothetical protein
LNGDSEVQVSLWRRLLEPGAWAAPVVILVSALLIRPVGEFPVLDDFDYVATVRDFLRTGEIRLSDWPSMTLIGQVNWGAAFSTLLGDTFLSLRISTLVLHAIGCLGAYLWLRDRNTSQAVSAFAAVAVATSPETLYFACSFMTDTPGLSMTLIVLLVSARSLNSDSLAMSILAGVVAAIAFLFRQTAVIPLLAAILIELYRRRFRHVAALTTPTLVVAIAHRYWLHRHGVPHHVAIPMINANVLMKRGEVLDRIARIAAVVGLYIAPVSFLRWNRSDFQPNVRLGCWLVAGILSIWMIAALVGPSFIPYDNATVFDFGIGADMSLDRSYVLDGPSLLVGSRRISVFRVVATTLAVISLAIAATSLRGIHRVVDPTIWHLRLSVLGSVAFAMISGSFYERYLIPAWSLAILGLAAFAPRPTKLAWSVLLLIAAWGVIGAEDYFRRFGTAWKAAEELRTANVPATSIDAGMEFAGWHQFNARFRGTKERVRPYISGLTDWERIELISPMVLNRYTPYRLTLPYAVSYTDDGEQLLRRYPYRSWLRSGVVYTLQRKKR